MNDDSLLVFWFFLLPFYDSDLATCILGGAAAWACLFFFEGAHVVWKYKQTCRRVSACVRHPYGEAAASIQSQTTSGPSSISQEAGMAALALGAVGRGFGVDLAKEKRARMKMKTERVVRLGGGGGGLGNDVHH